MPIESLAAAWPEERIHLPARQALVDAQQARAPANELTPYPLVQLHWDDSRCALPGEDQVPYLLVGVLAPTRAKHPGTQRGGDRMAEPGARLSHGRKQSLNGLYKFSIVLGA